MSQEQDTKLHKLLPGINMIILSSHLYSALLLQHYRTLFYKIPYVIPWENWNILNKIIIILYKNYLYITENMFVLNQIGYLLLLIVFSEPSSSFSPQWKCNWTNLYVPFNGPPLISGIFSLCSFTITESNQMHLKSTPNI